MLCIRPTAEKELLMSHSPAQTLRRRVIVSLAAVLATAALSSPARAQDVITKDAAAVLKASFIADLDVMKREVRSASLEAFPQDKYSWRPMEGVRSVGRKCWCSPRPKGMPSCRTSFGGKAGQRPAKN